ARATEVLGGRLPMVVSATPKSGQAGDRVVVAGRGFDPSAPGNDVTFSGQPALVLAATATELTVIGPTTPRGEGTLNAEVHVKAKGTQSTSSAAFPPPPASASVFVPRFFAAPVMEYPGENLAYVSTELGPFFVLGEKEAAGST